MLCKICLQLISWIPTLSNSCLEFKLKKAGKYYFGTNLLKSKMEACYSELILEDEILKLIMHTHNGLGFLSIYRVNKSSLQRWFDKIIYKTEMKFWAALGSQGCKEKKLPTSISMQLFGVFPTLLLDFTFEFWFISKVKTKYS